MKMIALILFIATYVFLLIFSNIRAYIALSFALLYILLGIVPIGKILYYIDWNVIMMIAGTMGIVSLFIESKMPEKLADIIIARMPNVRWVIVSLSLFAGFISAFVDNVATVLMIAPVALDISKKLKINPAPSIIAISISSNLQGAATLVGDTTALLLGGHADMNFLDFFFYQNKPGLFFIVQMGALLTSVVLLIIFRREGQYISYKSKTKVEDYFPTVLLVGMILLLILASFIPNKPDLTNGLICISLFLIGTFRRDMVSRNFDSLKVHSREIDFYTIGLLVGLFVVIGGIIEVGIVDDISKIIISLSKNNTFIVYTILVWFSVFISAFIDNIPYVATMLPVTSGIADILNIDPTVLYFGLIVGATLGGNLTPIGASANITGIGILRKEGYDVNTIQFMKISVPFTLVAVVSGYVFTWFLFGY